MLIVLGNHTFQHVQTMSIKDCIIYFRFNRNSGIEATTFILTFFVNGMDV